MKIVIPIIALSALIASGVSAWSGSPSTGSLQIKMKIDKACKVNPGGDAVLDFGEHGIFTAISSKMTRETSIHVQCTSGVPYKIGLDAGQNSIKQLFISYRYLKSANGDTILYYLTSPEINSGNDTDWGNNFSWHSGDRGQPTVAGTGDGTVRPHPVKGTFVTNALNGGYPPGTYTDTVTVTVQF